MDFRSPTRRRRWLEGFKTPFHRYAHTKLSSDPECKHWSLVSLSQPLAHKNCQIVSIENASDDEARFCFGDGIIKA